MQKGVDITYLDWSKNRKPAILSRGIASLVTLQLKGQTDWSKIKTACVWPSGIENVDSRYLSRRVWNR